MPEWIDVFLALLLGLSYGFMFGHIVGKRTR